MQSFPWTVRQIFQDRRQYCVPFYQRAYVWNKVEQWEPLWSDIKGKAQTRLANGTPTPHFLGAVVVEHQENTGLRGVDTFHIIDGQQRLTTLQYIFTAFLIALREVEVEALDAPLRECMQNGNPDTMNHPEVERYKVWPTFRDRANYESATGAESLQDLKNRFPNDFTQTGQFRRIGIKHPPSLAAIWFFASEFIEYIKGSEVEMRLAAETLAMAVLQDLKVVVISLEKDDDAQIIFETLNGRGAILNATDLVRNFIFMRAGRDTSIAEALYDKHWKQFESDTWSENERRGRVQKPRLEWMIYSMLQAETHTEIDLPRLYADYKGYALNGTEPRSAKKQLLTLDHYAEHYIELTMRQGSLPVAKFGRRIAAHEVTTVYSLALLISTSQLTDQDKAAMFNDIVSYIVRRAVCGLTSKNYNNVFMSTIRSLAENGITHESLRNHMAESSSDISRWPTDAEFKKAFRTAPLYPGNLDAPKTRYLLTELEGRLRSSRRSEEPETPNLTQLDIDHIMPKSWYNHWPIESNSNITEQEAQGASRAEQLGETLTDTQKQILQRQVAISRLGNLTLLNLSVNREAQNREFPVKRELLIRNTNLSLNVQLLNCGAWDVEEIARRGEHLADTAVELYPSPPDEMLAS